ncbi:winged helix-turn-helix domain-containing protein [Streptomyces sp. F8]|nr:winged helix-turn-helix domain-containing protein [Streptomyces sp. F8]MDX6763847.1 winged helix-turn-helix domain-containing protein [Streptomyces sp. F8]
MQAVGLFEQTARTWRPLGACGSACNGTSRGATAGLRHRSLGWVEDQVRTASRVATLIGRKFHLSPLLYSVSGATRLMHRLGSSPQAPARCVAERDEQAVTAGKEATRAEVKGRPGRPAGPRLLRGRSGLHPPAAPGTDLGQARRGATPVVTASGRRSGRLPVAGLTPNIPAPP